MHPATSSRKNNLESMDLFVLFDLLGDSNPRVPSYFPMTHWAYNSMSQIENQLRTTGLAVSGAHQKWLVEGDTYDAGGYKGGIEDDHIPFLRRGVDILHIIPVTLI
jgi:glutaminyl-peptide cyclotransferase